MRLAFLISLLAVSGVASASFELVLALDYNNHKIHRIDGDNNLYLGSFGGNRLFDVSGMALQQSANRVHVYDSSLSAVVSFNYNTGEQVAETAMPSFGGNRLFDVSGMALQQSANRVHVYDGALSAVRSFNYNTGEQVAETAMPSFGFAQLALANNGDFLIGDFYTATARRYSQSGSLLATFTAPAGATGARAMMQGPEGNFYVAWSGSNSITRHNSTGAIVSTALASNAALADTRQMFIQNNQVVISGAGSGKWLRSGYSTSTSWGAVTQVSSLTFSYGVSGSHFNTVYVGGAATAGVGVLNSYHLTTGLNTSTLTIPGAGNIIALGTVIAPEPSTLAAMLLVGGLGLLRRRKRSEITMG